jgi:hypothetical protein
MVQTEPDKALRCHLYGCSARRYTDPETGHMHDFCGWTHSYKALVTGQQAPPTANLSAHASVPILEGSFIATFGGRAGGPDYSISLMTNRHPKYKRIKQEFLDGWGVDAPVVVRIWQVRNSADIWQQYRQYEDEVGQKARRLHGTKMTCSFAVDINQRPCDDPECSVCSICESGFKLSRARGGALTRSFTRLNGQLRYGTGLYFSKHLRKSHGYAVDSQQPLHAKAAAAAAASASGGSKLVRCMFLCRVALGVPLRTVEEKLDEAKVCNAAAHRPSCVVPAHQPTREARSNLGAVLTPRAAQFSLTEPCLAQVDAGIKARGQGGKYDSVLGLTEADGGRLNYEDNVLYDERAAIPSYLIVYEVPGPARPGQ